MNENTLKNPQSYIDGCCVGLYLHPGSLSTPVASITMPKPKSAGAAAAATVITRVHLITNNYLIMWQIEQILRDTVPDYIVERAVMIKDVTHCNTYLFAEPLKGVTPTTLKTRMVKALGPTTATVQFDIIFQTATE